MDALAELPVCWREDNARDVIEAWRASGMSVAAFARCHRLRVECLRRWRRRLGDEPRFVRLIVGSATNEPAQLISGLAASGWRSARSAPRQAPDRVRGTGHGVPKRRAWSARWTPYSAPSVCW